MMKMAFYHQQIVKYYDARVKVKEFRIGDVVLWRVDVLQPIKQGKLSSNWEGLYLVDGVVRPGTYHLK